MRYLVCDTDGQLHDRTVDGYYRTVLTGEVGPEGFESVRVRHGMHAGWMAGVVNEIGLLDPDRYPRNVIGSCLLVALGASAQPYAGPVVITGWDDHADSEFCDLTDELAVAVTQVHRDIRIVLGLESGPTSDHALPRWQVNIAEFAGWVESSPTPEVQIITDEAAVDAFLRGGR